MQFSVSFDGKSPKEIAAQLRVYANLLDGNTGTTETARKTKAAKAEVDEETDNPETEDEDPKSKTKTAKKTKAVDYDESTEADDTDSDDYDVDAEADDEPKARGEFKKINLNDTILPAFKRYRDKHGDQKAIKILKQFNAKSVRDIDESDYSKVLKLLN